MAPISQAFIAAIEAFVAEHRLPLITFEKGQRKDDGGPPGPVHRARGREERK
jgi:hypothetical protein